MLRLLLIVITGSVNLITSVYADDLTSYLNKVKNKNLDVISQSAITHAALERSKGFALKPPMIGVGQMTNSEDTAYAFEVQQEFPLSSRLSHDKSSREFQYELQKKESHYVSQEIILQARLAFVSYWMSYNKLQLIEELRDWLKKHSLYAQSQVRSSSDIKVYALEVESALGIYENDASSLKNNLEIEKTKLKEMAYDHTYDPGVPVIDDPKSLPEASPTSKLSAINLSKLKIANSNLDVAKSAYSPNLSVRIRKLDRPMIGM
ncbi:MAG TPA: hypothetical protein VNJ08_06865, partial [Bacteriovoracaceae bacterium]|nr:hypothetical protein [Bacteriovoracaceae bacterium]